MIRALVFATILAAVKAQALSCNDVPDVEAQCKLDCADSLVDFDCGAYGVDCFCRNEQGEIENTNVDAPIGCGDNAIEDLCGPKCNGIQFLDDFKCKNDDTADCTCAPDDGIPNLGDDATQEDLDYSELKDEEAKQIEEELEKNPNPAPPTLVENENGDLTIIPSVADAPVMAPPAEVSEPPASSALAQAIGGSVLAMGAAFMFT